MSTKQSPEDALREALNTVEYKRSMRHIALGFAIKNSVRKGVYSAKSVVEQADAFYKFLVEA